jgi:dolichol-phosphate mannosyltransferase
MDGDGQCKAADIKRLVEHFPEYDFVNGFRESRRDGLCRAVASRVGNSARNAILRDGVKDTCGTPKAMKRECVAYLVPFDGLHRFIPAFLQRAGFRTLEVPVSHRERLHGATKYISRRRALRGVWDLIGVSWLLRRKIDPDALGIPMADSDGN